MFTLAISCWTLPIYLIPGPKISYSYAIFFFTPSDFTSITSHIHNCVCVCVCVVPLFILSVAISPLFSRSILGTCWPGEFIFPKFLPFYTVHGVLKARILKWIAFPSPEDHVLSELFTMTCPFLVFLYGMAHGFIELDKALVHVISLVSFLCFVVFILSALWWLRRRDLWKLLDGMDCLWRNLSLVLKRSNLSKSLIQLSLDRWGCVPSLLFGLRPNYVRVNDKFLPYPGLLWWLRL